MALPPQKFREIVFQLLYSQDFTPIDPAESIPFMMHELNVTKRTMLEVHARIDKILEKYPEIDRKIEASSISYSFERISKVEKTILRVGVFELLYDDAIPEKVAIAEAIRLSRKFGTPESAQFVNAILDAIYKEGIPKHQFERNPPLLPPGSDSPLLTYGQQDMSSSGKREPTPKSSNLTCEASFAIPSKKKVPSAELSNEPVTV
jgi:N utilization substance protein B